MRREALALIAVAFVACANFAALDDHAPASELQGAGGVATAGSGVGPAPSSDGVSPGAGGAGQNPAPMTGTDGVPPIMGIGGGGGPSGALPDDAALPDDVAPPDGVPGDAGAAGDESGTDAGVEPTFPPEPPPPPGTVRFVALVADSEVRGAAVACISDFNLLGPDGRVLDRALWRASADSAEPTYLGGAPAQQAIDDDRLSLWHTAWFELDAPPDYPHFLLVDLGAFVQVTGFRYFPRQDSSSGRIAAYRFFASAGSELGEPVASGVFPDNAQEQTVSFSLD